MALSEPHFLAQCEDRFSAVFFIANERAVSSILDMMLRLLMVAFTVVLAVASNSCCCLF
jgi:hypothetical protein